MPRIRFLLVFGLLIAGVLLASMGKPDPRVSFTSLLSLWSDALRDADQPGMRLTRLSDADEMRIGNDLAAHMHASPDAYLQDVGEALLPNVRRPGIRYEFRLVESPAVNAFALPGGRVFVTTAMFDALESEAELAAVLGHEIAHVDLRHCVERYQYEYRLKQAGAPLTGWMIEVVHRLATMGFAPYQELEADAQGEVLAIKAGYDPGLDGNVSMMIKDPDGHNVEFVQYMPGSLHSRNFGKFLPDTRISERIIHVGVTVQDRAAADQFYKDILGFRETWHGGRDDNHTDWVDMRVPDGTDWLEYMLNQNNPSPKTRGVMNHMALGVPSVDAGYKTLQGRQMPIADPPKIGRDGKWQLNLYDPDLTRAELMEPKPVQTPCCSEMRQ